MSVDTVIQAAVEVTLDVPEAEMFRRLDELRGRIIAVVAEAFPDAAEVRLLRPYTTDGWS